MSDKEKQVEIKKGYTPPKPPKEPGGKTYTEGHVPSPPPVKPKEGPPDEPSNKD